ncbi:hypothetical protein [Halorubrum sp. AJ67]|uniref:hypothetical protein n=1 Tax=Halorubrum sp. AJ67 TaxID=1173487 RepID=UPI0003DB8E69|nr:hypothetical protein [Halorubrum sp. AJ67]CDK39287.1 hypothetical protein BN903_61 [Halorubrum sp. AJ67]
MNSNVPQAPTRQESGDGPKTITRDSNRRYLSHSELGDTDSHGRISLSVSGMAVLLATKFADALTTGVGLAYVPAVYEVNPIARPVFEGLGITDGLLFSSIAVIVVIVTVTEIAALAIARRRRDGHLAPVVRAVGYGLPSLLFAAVAVRNAAVLVEAVEPLGPL